MEKITTIETYIEKNDQWATELDEIRKIINQTELYETMKWSMPTYTINNKNVLGVGAFKSFINLWFHQGAFLKDKAQKLSNAQEGKTKGMRHWKIYSIDDIIKNKDLIKAYIDEAIENQKLGKEIKPQKKKELTIPKQLKSLLDSNQTLKESFELLSPSCQREYFEYIMEAKKDETKQRRLEKITPMILNGSGLNDKYK